MLHHLSRRAPLAGDCSLRGIASDQLGFCLSSMFRSVIHILPPTTVGLLFTAHYQPVQRYIQSISSTHTSSDAEKPSSLKTRAIFRKCTHPLYGRVPHTAVVQYIERSLPRVQRILLSQENLRTSPANRPPACARNPPPANMSSPPRKIIPTSPRTPPAAASSP